MRLLFMDSERESEHKFMELVTDSNLQDITAGVSEVFVDEIMEEGLLRDVPVFGPLVGLCRFVSGMGERRFAKKLHLFLRQFDDLNPAERLEFKTLFSSKIEEERFAAKMMEALDRVELHGKPELLGRLLRAVIDKKLSLPAFYRLNHVVSQAYYPDLERLRSQWMDKERLPGNDQLVILGLVEPDFLGAYDAAKAGEVGDRWSRGDFSDLGRMLCEFGWS